MGLTQRGARLKDGMTNRQEKSLGVAFAAFAALSIRALAELRFGPRAWPFVLQVVEACFLLAIGIVGVFALARAISREGWTSSTSVVAIIGFVSLCGLPLAHQLHKRHTWQFIEDVDPMALGFDTPIESAGPWRLEAEPTATGARALMNDYGTQGAPALLVARHIHTRDVRIATRCRAESPDEACGVFLRYQNPNQYCAVLVDDRGRVKIARVENGAHETLAEAHVPDARWYDLDVHADGARIFVSANGTELSADTDAMRPGGVGLWAAPTTRAWFDVLTVTEL